MRAPKLQGWLARILAGVVLTQAALHLARPVTSYRALALGADAVLYGRPYLYGLAIDGRHGVAHVLRCLLAELDLALALVGCPSIADITPDLLAHTPCDDFG